MAEQRAIGDLELNGVGNSAPIEFVLTSIAWREEWKYRDRAYRYCLLDIGHAWQTLVLAAQAIGCEAVAVGEFADDEISASCRLPEDEWPMLIVELRGATIPICERDAVGSNWTDGVPNQLSKEVVEYPRIESMHRATKLEGRYDVSALRSLRVWAMGASLCLRRNHPSVALARSLDHDARRSISKVARGRSRRPNSQRSLRPHVHSSLRTLPGHRSSNSTYMSIGLTVWNPGSTGSGRNGMSWNR